MSKQMKKLMKRLRLKKCRSYLRYATFRWIMPSLGHDPLFHMNLAERAWPRVAAMTASRKYTDRIESIDCAANSPVDEYSDELQEHASNSRPFVLRGYIDKDKWELEQVKKEAGDSINNIRVGHYDEATDDPDVIRMRLADFIDHISGQSEFLREDLLADEKGAYLANEAIPSLAKRLPVQSIFPDTDSGKLFWLGSSSRSPLHCHQNCDVLLVQLVGNRKVMLVPPHQASLVGCIPRNYNVCSAKFDPFEPDQQPSLATDLIHRLYCELNPGDALLIPGFWFHAVRVTEPSFAVSLFNKHEMPLAVGGGPRGPWQKRSYAQGWG